MKNLIFVSLLSFCILSACVDIKPNENIEGEDRLESLEISQDIDVKNLAYQDIVYVPIYSDIYFDESSEKCLLSATLSIRNTSFQDSLFVSKIDYYNTAGLLVRSYLSTPISLSPMASVNYVIEREDDSGGSGANFIVELSGNNEKLKPIIEAVMIGNYGNKSFSFLSPGESISMD